MKLLLIVGATTLSLILLINLFVSLVIYIAEEYHVIDQVKIYQLFQNERYKNIRQDLLKYNYTIIIGNDKSGLKNFMEHQANLNTLSGKPVLVKKYQNKNQEKMKILKTIKQTRFYLQVRLGIDREERTQIFFVEKLDDVPFEQIQFIRQKYPNDNIIIVCAKQLPIKIKSFKKVYFPRVDLKQLKDTMRTFYNIKSQNADKIIQHYNQNVQQIFRHFKEIAQEQNEIVQDLIQVEDITTLNVLSDQRAKQQQKSKKKEVNKKTK